MLNNIAIGIIIGLLFVSLVILFCVVLIKLYINKVKKYTQQLYQKDIDFQKFLNQTILETQEQVLNNISQDLHDDAGQQLTYINFQLENLKLDSAELNTLLEPLSQSVGNLSSSIRSISHSLNNQLLLQQDLFKAIATEVERLQKNPKIKIVLNQEEQTKKEFTANEKIVIYRIFQEIINNTLKHAKAKQISVTISTTPSFAMTIQDNGKGFDQKVVGNKQSLGLQNMSSRATIINYKLTINSEIGEGTTITLSEN
ncbi:MAG: ATP-binding protein [Flavobacterium sp.]|uniref:sensor histidine kinase n=1 Tax=Flavobacterium sp. TaxID=239 RepID=UPI0022C830C5|nr:ATP-binding protein [Flavobacterium sp.]MCZ8198185.1 ATP-binding protein [Flavobacterium sp.]